jgi:hypothetical protein
MNSSPGNNIAIALLFLAVSLSACSKSNNLLLGRVETVLGAHTVVVTDCYRTSVSSPQASRDSVDGSLIYRFMPCKDAEVIIHNEHLIVNGLGYESLSPGDTVIVDHGQVLVNTHIARRASDPAAQSGSRLHR